MDIQQATKSYEQWMREHTTIVESHLRYKHEQMKEDLFLFFRGTFYRWAQLWPEIYADLRKAPFVLSSSDLHVNSFGTWRDSEGRLCRGVDDFDESYPLPYTHDLVRLAASLKIVIESKDLTIKLKHGCEIVLNAYRDALRSGGKPIVLAEKRAASRGAWNRGDQTAEKFLEKVKSASDDQAWTAFGRQRSVRKDASRAEPGLQSSIEGGGDGKPRPTALCRDCQLVRRLHRARGKSDGSLSLELARG